MTPLLLLLGACRPTPGPMADAGAPADVGTPADAVAPADAPGVYEDIALTASPGPLTALLDGVAPAPGMRLTRGSIVVTPTVWVNADFEAGELVYADIAFEAEGLVDADIVVSAGSGDGAPVVLQSWSIPVETQGLDLAGELRGTVAVSAEVEGTSSFSTTLAGTTDIRWEIDYRRPISGTRSGWQRSDLALSRPTSPPSDTAGQLNVYVTAELVLDGRSVGRWESGAALVFDAEPTSWWFGVGPSSAWWVDPTPLLGPDYISEEGDGIDAEERFVGPPLLDTIWPVIFAPGARETVTVSAYRAGDESGPVVSAGAGVDVGAATWSGGMYVYAPFAVDADAACGVRDLTLTTGEGAWEASDTWAGAFAVWTPRGDGCGGAWSRVDEHGAETAATFPDTPDAGGTRYRLPLTLDVVPSSVTVVPIGRGTLSASIDGVPVGSVSGCLGTAYQPMCDCGPDAGTIALTPEPESGLRSGANILELTFVPEGEGDFDFRLATPAGPDRTGLVSCPSPGGDDD
ncbi:MAG: hypothetical protein Q8P41_18150 [Pseudomonadota bacterium]|nr:hypothetical protein [Pseudomonadota bacterium]